RRLDLTLSRVAGVFLFGVPSNGASLADSDSLLARFVGSRYKVVKDLDPKKAAGFLITTDNAWHKLVDNRIKRLFVYCAYERGLQGGVLTIVDELFAKTRCTDEAMPFSYPHTLLVKPDSIDHEIHLWLRGRINKASGVINSLDTYPVEPGNKPFA